MVRKVDEHWLVVGPTGLFVIGRVINDAAIDAGRAVQVAQRLRDLLSLNMAWVPFVDVLLIGHDVSDDVGCSVVRPDLLESVLIDGHTRMDIATMFEVRRLLPRLAHELAS